MNHQHHGIFRFLCGLLPALLATPLAAQTAATDVRDEVFRHFEQSTSKLVALAEAMPAELYDWSPGEGVMSVARVYMHIARYNYLYPATALGVPAPDDVDMDSMEETVRDKDRVVAHLRRSIEHARAVATGMDTAALARRTRLYGRDVAGWTVLLQLVAHLNEHVGQSVAYARMNGVVPPWSR